jgi:hypothetical protein
MKPFFTRVLFFILIVSTVVLPQQMKMMIKNDGSSEFLPEIKGAVVFENGKVSINFAFPADQREKEYQNIDLQKGDEIQFVNGTRIKTLNDFKKYFSEAEVGKEIKLGVKRNDSRFIVAFKKAKQEMGGQKMIIMNGEGKGKMKVEGGKIMMGNKKIDLDSLKKAGGNIYYKSEKK